jgi:hypothetical protein
MCATYKKLVTSVLLDTVGMLFFIFPGIGGDVICTPLSAYFIGLKSS